MTDRVDLDALEADMASLDFSHSLGVPEVSRLIGELRRLRRVEDWLESFRQQTVELPLGAYEPRDSQRCCTSTFNWHIWIITLEDKLRGMTATMQHWRALAGQMTEGRDALLGEVGVLREALEAEMSHTRERIERVTAGLVNIQRHRDAWRRYATQGGAKPGDYVEDTAPVVSGAGSEVQAVIEAAVALDEGMPREGETMDFEPVFALIDAVREAVAAMRESGAVDVLRERITELEEEPHNMHGDNNAMARQVDALRTQITMLKDQLSSACEGRDNWYLAYTQDTARLFERISELETEKAAHVCGFRVTKTIRTPDLVIEEDAAGLATLCICGHLLSTHDPRCTDDNYDNVGCLHRETNGSYCDCDVFKARKVEE